MTDCSGKSDTEIIFHIPQNAGRTVQAAAKFHCKGGAPLQTLEEYIETHQEGFYRLAFTYVKNRDAAMDVVQNAVVHALTHAESLRRAEYMRAWFTRILINESLQYLRKNRRFLPADFYPDDFACEDRDIAQKLDIYRAVGRLKPKLRTVVILRFFEDMQLNEISAVTGVNLSTVKTRLYKALSELKAEISEESLPGQPDRLHILDRKGE